MGSMSKLRGVLPCVGVWSSSVKVPLAGSMENTVILSWPRLEA